MAWRPPAARTPLTLPRLPCRFSEPTASVPPQSDVYRMLHNNQDEPTHPRQSGSFRVLQELVNDGEWLGRLLTVIGRACWQARGRGGQQTDWECKSKYGFYSEIKRVLAQRMRVEPGLGEALPGRVTWWKDTQRQFHPQCSRAGWAATF